MSSDRKTPSSILSFLGIIVLTTISGMGAMWVVIALPASMVLNKSGQDNFIAHGMPILELGGALGFLAGILLAAYIAKANPQTKARLEEKFVRRGDRVRIYFGAPFFVTVVLGQWFERLPRLVGESAFPYVGLGIFLVIVAISLFFTTTSQGDWWFQ